jgi:hypothetical protein
MEFMRTLFLAAVLAAMPAFAHALDYANGYLTCKILESFQMKVEDGKSTTYTYYPEGEPLRLEFEVSNYTGFRANLIIRNTTQMTVEVPLEEFEVLGDYVLGNQGSTDAFDFSGGVYMGLSNSISEMSLYKYSSNAWHAISVGNFYQDYASKPDGAARLVFSMDCQSEGDATMKNFFKDMKIIINS